MRIVVCIKQVPDTTEVKIDPVKGTIIRDGVPSIMNPDDKGGLEEALKLKDLYGAEVIVITMGPPQAEAILREAYAMGADRAILITDRKFGGADTLATSNTIAAAIRKIENIDLIVAGRQAIDGDTAQVGPQIAEHLDLPQVSYVKEMKYNEASKSFEIKRATEDGYFLLELPTPGLVTVLAEAKPIFAGSISISSNVQVSIGLAGSPTKVNKSFTKGVKEPGVLHEVDPKEAANIILEKLKEKFII